MNFEKHWTKLQNLILYNNNLNFIYIMATVSLNTYFLNNLNRIDPKVGKRCTKLQNLILYNNNLKFLYIMATVSLNNYFLNNLNRIDPKVEK